jgi:hypothetical protein
VAAVSFILLGIIGTARAGSYDGPGFSGTAWIAENGGEIRQMGDVHVGAGGFRMNMVTQGQHMSSLIKWNSDSVWSLMHDQKMYMEIPREQTGLEAFDPKPCSGFEQGEKVGPETVSGRKTEKWRCTGQKMVPPGQQPSDATTWYDPALKFEIKTVDDSGNVFEIRDIAVGAQDAAMFQIPSGYRELDMNGLMQQMMKQQGQQ